MTTRTIVEDLNYAAQEPSSAAAQQAKQLGLMYVGFGRYEDPTTKQITHIVQNDRLIPFRKAIKTNTYKSSSTNDLGTFSASMNADVQQLNDVLTQAYGPENYDEKELAAIQDFTSQSYSNVNDLLARLPAGIAANKIQPQGPNDTTPDVIAGLDSAVKKVRSPVDFIAYAKLDGSVDRKNIIPGTQFRFKSFRNIATNLASIIDPNDASVNVLQIRVKKNSRGIYAADYSSTPEDGEFILPRGTKIEVAAGPTKLVGSDERSTINKEIYYYDCVVKA